MVVFDDYFWWLFSAWVFYCPWWLWLIVMLVVFDDYFWWLFSAWVLKLGFWLFDECQWKFLIYKGFWCCLCIGIDKKWFRFVLGWFRIHEKKFYRFSKLCRICVRWLELCPMINFVTNDHIGVQWPVLNLNINFDSWKSILMGCY